MTDQQRFEHFVQDLTAISKKHGVAVMTIGGVFILENAEAAQGITYTNDASSGDLEFKLSKTLKSTENDGSRKALRVRFTRKPSDIHEVKSAAWNSDAEVYECEIEETIVLPVAHYDAFCRLMYKDWDWLAGKGGFKNNVRQVLKVTAPERETLYVDPSGYSYARYVGIAVNAHAAAGA